MVRFLTHLSAPGFFFLMGAGMTLFTASRRKRGWDRWAILRLFLIRGVLLILLQLSLINLTWQLGPEPFPAIYIGVLVALGGTMVLGGLLLRLPDLVLVALSVGLFVGSEWLHPKPEMWGQIINDPLNLVLVRSGGDFGLWSNYPILPWLELVVIGLLFGRWLLSDAPMAYRRGLALGGAFLLLFGMLRALDGFGNIRPRPGDDWIWIPSSSWDSAFRPIAALVHPGGALRLCEWAEYHFNYHRLRRISGRRPLQGPVSLP